MDEAYRRRKIASQMIAFAEAYCRTNHSIDKFELLTGKENIAAQALYGALGYRADDEMHLTRQRYAL